MKQPDGSMGPSDELYTYYRLTYSMKVKDSEALINEALKSAGLTVKMGNSIDSRVGSDETTVEYTPNVLDKFKSGQDGDKIEFTIKVNEAQIDLQPDSNVLILTDTLENISAQYQDIEISFPRDNYSAGDIKTTDEGGNEVAVPYFNMKGDTITFYLPDNVETHIRYKAKPAGEVGPDGKIHYKNTANLKGYTKTVSDIVDWSGNASGTSTNYGVYLYKANGYVNSQRLGGAKFKLFIADEVDENGNVVSGTPLKDKNGNDFIVTSSANGNIEIRGGDHLASDSDEQKKCRPESEWNLRPETRYYLVEVEAPEGCALDNTKYQFVISSQGYVNYSRNAIAAPDGSGAIIEPWTYYNGDVLTVKNWPKDGVLKITKSFADDSDIKNINDLDDEQKSAVKFEVYQEVTESGTTHWKLLKTVGLDEFITNTYTIGDLPAGKYKVVESVNDSACKETTYAVTLEDSKDTVSEDLKYATVVISEEDIKNNREHGVTVTNKYEKESIFKIYKYAKIGSSTSTDLKLAGAEFTVYGKNDTEINKYTTDNHGRFDIKPDGEKIKYGEVYKLKETKAPEGYQVSQDEILFCFLSVGETEGPAGVAESVILIPFGETQNLSVPNTPDTTSVGVKKLWMNQFLVEDAAQSGTAVTVKIKQTASYDKAGKLVARDDEGNKQVKYYPDETTVFTATKDNNIWKLSTENRYVNIDSTGRVIGLPTVTVTGKGVPLYYTYTLEETPVPNDYTAIYTEEIGADGKTVTITNRPKDIMSTVNVKAKKVWVDANNKDITSEMGVKDGVTVEVYRKEGVVKAGTLIEGDKRTSAGALMPIVFKAANGGQIAPVFSQSGMGVLPGDQIKMTISLISKNGDVPQASQITIGQMNDGNNIQTPVSVEKNGDSFTAVYTVQENDKIIGAKTAFTNAASFEVEIENISAANRTQVLTQDEANGVGGDLVQTLDELNKMNNWQATSRDFPSGSGNTIYSYYIVEKNGAGDTKYEMSGDQIIVKNVDKRLRVDKKWFNPDATAQLEQTDGEITYDLIQVANGSEYKEGQYSDDGPYNVDISEMLTGDIQNNNNKPGSITVTGDVHIRPGSNVKITIQVNNGDVNTLDPNNPNYPFKVTGCQSYYLGAVQTDSDYNNTKIKYRDITVTNVTSTIKLQGYIDIKNEKTEVTITVDVLGEYAAKEGSDENKIGTVTMTYDDASIELEESFAESGISVAPGKEHWSSIISKLPSGSTDESGAPVTYTYRVEEKSWPDSFDQMPVKPNGAVSNSGTVTISNKAKPAKVRVTKAFVGLKTSEIPEDFKITNDQNDEVFTVENANGKGTKDNPYYWEIDNLMEGTRVTFYETGVVVDGKELRIEANGKASNDGHASAVAAIVTGTESVPTASLVNDYSAAKGALKFTKKVTVNGNAIENVSEELKKAADGEFTFTVTGPDKNPVATVIFTVTDGQVTSATRDGDAVTLDDNKYVTIKDLDLGEYTVTETDTGAFTLSSITGGKKDSADLANKKVTLTVAAGETIEDEAQAIFTNNLAVTGFEFSKVWLAMTADASEISSNDLHSWPSGKSISVKVFRKNGDTNKATKDEKFELVYDINDSGNTVSLISGKINNEQITDVEKAKYQLTRTVNDNIATFSIGPVLDVEKDGTSWIYYVEETSVPEGYLKDGYGTMSTAVGTGTTISKDPGAEAAASGGVILNRESSGYELPQTGGIGTTLFTALGGLMTATAGAILTIKSWHRRKENA